MTTRKAYTTKEKEILTKQLFYYCREKAQKALWFAETYGITLKTLEMEGQTGKQITVNLSSGKITDCMTSLVINKMKTDLYKTNV